MFLEKVKVIRDSLVSPLLPIQLKRKKLRNKPMSQELGFAFLGGWLLGVIFTFFKLPLPVPPFQGLVAAAAVLLGQVTYNFIKERFAL